MESLGIFKMNKSFLEGILIGTLFWLFVFGTIAFFSFLVHAQTLTMHEKDYGFCKVIGGEIVYWQDGDTIRAKSVDTTPSRHVKGKGPPWNSENWEYDDNYAKEDITSLQEAQHRESTQDYFSAGEYYRDAGMEEDAVRMFVAHAEKMLQNDPPEYGRSANAYEYARLYDRAIEVYEKEKEEYIKLGEYRSALQVEKYIISSKREKEIYEKSKGGKP